MGYQEIIDCLSPAIRKVYAKDPERMQAELARVRDIAALSKDAPSGADKLGASSRLIAWIKAR